MSDSDHSILLSSLVLMRTRSQYITSGMKYRHPSPYLFSSFKREKVFQTLEQESDGKEVELHRHLLRMASLRFSSMQFIIRCHGYKA